MHNDSEEGLRKVEEGKYTFLVTNVIKHKLNK